MSRYHWTHGVFRQCLEPRNQQNNINVSENKAGIDFYIRSMRVTCCLKDTEARALKNKTFDLYILRI